MTYGIRTYIQCSRLNMSVSGWGGFATSCSELSWLFDSTHWNEAHSDPFSSV